MVVAALQVALAQQGCPAPPQISQAMPPSRSTQPVPGAVHSPLPALTTLAWPQQVWPMPPQAVHTAPPASPTFCPTQVLLVQSLPGQQACPTVPQFTHWALGLHSPARQQLPVPHELPGQHAWPLPPQRTQLLTLSQTALAPVQT